jgi:glycogen phosphorylase
MNIELSFKLPKRINGLAALSYNLWWSWNMEARELFKILDRRLWSEVVHNPVKFLQHIPQQVLVAASQNPKFLEKYDAVMALFHKDLTETKTWFYTNYPDMAKHVIAYFSLEFAIHNSLPIYAGGLGILAGDYCKESNDIGIPLLGVGFMYPQGYFHQHVNSEGWQEEIYQHMNFAEAPISPLLNENGQRIIVNVPLNDHGVNVAVWVVNIGRNKLYLLDTNLEENSPEDRELTARLYIADKETRLQQEIVIGIGGVRVLRTLGLNPCIWHVNEGHTAFMMLERIRELYKTGVPFNEAVEQVRSSSIFTTHTPVPAGNDVFPAALVEKHLSHYWREMDIDRNLLLKLGIHPSNPSEFNMAVLAINLSSQRNAVSQKHAETCRRIWHYLWPDIPENEVPISYVTNGIHVASWISPQMDGLLNKYFGSDWQERIDEPELWQKVLDMPDDEIWRTRRWLKYKLIRAIEDRIRRRWSEDTITPAQALAMGSLLDTDALTIGFCRRATEYKRATLIFRDMDRLKRILKDTMNPVQIVFAGKAHPNDITGKHIIQEIYKHANDPEIEGRIAFIEDYDLHMARFLVHGIDVWLNNPRWGEEASGTSGMKSCLNGGLHLSMVDGWWNEGFNGNNGWGIDRDLNAKDDESTDTADAEHIYQIIEEKVIPLYYERDLEGVPHKWLRMIKESMRSIPPFFNTRRMAKEYTRSMYVNAADHIHTENTDPINPLSASDYSI